MKILRPLIIFSLLVCAQISFAQRVLNIKSTSTSKVRVLKNESKIQFTLKGDSSLIKGVIQLISDSSIVMLLPEDENTMVKEYKLSEFALIKKPTALHSIARIAGAPLLIIGGISFIAGTMSTISPRDGESGGPVTMGVGAGALVLGILPYLIKPKTYDLTKDCELVVTNYLK
jgi:hypothetical protein